VAVEDISVLVIILRRFLQSNEEVILSPSNLPRGARICGAIAIGWRLLVAGFFARKALNSTDLGSLVVPIVEGYAIQWRIV